MNRTYYRTGTLFEGRFRLSVIEADRYLFACQRYIELNPVRARMVPDPGDFSWSSYRRDALGAADPVLVPHSIYRGYLFRVQSTLVPRASDGGRSQTIRGNHYA